MIRSSHKAIIPRSYFTTILYDEITENLLHSIFILLNLWQQKKNPRVIILQSILLRKQD